MSTLSTALLLPDVAYRRNTSAAERAGSGIYANNVTDGFSSSGGPSAPSRTYHQGNHAFGDLGSGSFVSSLYGNGGSSRSSSD